MMGGLSSFAYGPAPGDGDVPWLSSMPAIATDGAENGVAASTANRMSSRSNKATQISPES